MPNGKPADHPLTDVLTHGMDVFSPRADALLREIAALGGIEELTQRFDFFGLEPGFGHVVDPGKLAEFEQQLVALRDRLRDDPGGHRS